MYRCREKTWPPAGFARVIVSILALVGVTPTAGHGDPDEAAKSAVKKIVSEVDEGGDVSSLLLPTADLGAAAAIDCSRYIDPAKSSRNAVLMEVIALAAQSRRSHVELLKLYDPAAYRLFYLDDGVGGQDAI